MKFYSPIDSKNDDILINLEKCAVIKKTHFRVNDDYFCIEFITHNNTTQIKYKNMQCRDKEFLRILGLLN